MPKYETEGALGGIMGRLAEALRRTISRFGLKDELDRITEKLENISTRIERFVEEKTGLGDFKPTTKRVSRPVAAKRAGGAKRSRKSRPVDPELSAKKSAAGKKGAAARWGKVKKSGASKKKSTGSRSHTKKSGGHKKSESSTHKSAE